ncbi:unnamed protein product [Amoebophrya sp. A25]|nr:unnamed protein product [Amoebophrya sp. A25]|eukprot:GSA25T00016722001.1
MNLFFGGKKKEAAAPPKPKVNLGSEAADTIKKLRGDITALEKRRKYMDVQVTELDETVREKVRKKDKNGAKMALLRKQALVKNAGQIDNQILTLENQCMQLENATTNMTAVKAMESGLNMQKKIAKEMNADKVETLFDELAEQNEFSNEVSDLFAQNAEQIGGDMDVDEELDQLSAQLLQEDLLNTQAVPAGGQPSRAPAAAAPSAAPAQEAKPSASALAADEEAQLAELQAQLNFA